MSLIYSNDMKENNMKYCNIKLDNDMVFYIHNINNMELYLKITQIIIILSSKMTCF